MHPSQGQELCDGGKSKAGHACGLRASLPGRQAEAQGLSPGEAARSRGNGARFGGDATCAGKRRGSCGVPATGWLSGLSRPSEGGSVAESGRHPPKGALATQRDPPEASFFARPSLVPWPSKGLPTLPIRALLLAPAPLHRRPAGWPTKARLLSKLGRSPPLCLLKRPLGSVSHPSGTTTSASTTTHQLWRAA